MDLFTYNRAKASDLALIDKDTYRLVRRFNPRSDEWQEHFRMERNGLIIPLTDVGRVAEFLLKLNLPEHLNIRKTLTRSTRYP